MSAAPVFYTTPRVVNNTANFAAASTGRGLTGVTGLVDVATGAATGSRINRVTVMHNKDTSTPTATNVIRFFAYDGASTRLVHEHNITGAAAATVATAGYKAIVPELAGLILPSTADKLQAGIGTFGAGPVDTFTIIVELADA